MFTRRDLLGQMAAASMVSASVARATDAEHTPSQRANSRRGGQRVIGAVRRDETILRLGGSADNFHMSWAADDRQYIAICDGSGWSDRPYRYNSRLFTVSGDPRSAVFQDVVGYPDLIRMTAADETGGTCHYYGFGTLALDGGIYQFLSTRNHAPKHTDGHEREGLRFIGAKLIYSPNGGRIWCNQDGTTPVVWEQWHERSRQNMVFFEEPQDAFSLLSILQMGRNYEHNRDGYVYVCAPNGNVEGTMNELVMLRVAKGLILDRRAYEYFAGFHASGAARWSTDINARRAVHTFPAGWVGKLQHAWSWLPSLAYNPGLGLYMMTSWGTGSGADGWWFGRPSYFGLWIAEHPWGPYTQIHEETAWLPGADPASRAYSPVIAPKWISADGMSFWLVWSDFQTTKNPEIARLLTAPLRERTLQWREQYNVEFARLLPYYGFNTQRVDLVLG